MQGATTPADYLCTDQASWLTKDMNARAFTISMNAKKHKRRWEGIHFLRVKHEIFDTGNPLTGLNDSPVPRVGPRPLLAEFGTPTEKITLHAAYCDDKEYPPPFALSVDVSPYELKTVKVPILLAIPEKDNADFTALDYPFTDIELTDVCHKAQIKLDGLTKGVPDFV